MTTANDLYLDIQQIVADMRAGHLSLYDYGECRAYVWARAKELGLTDDLNAILNAASEDRAR